MSESGGAGHYPAFENKYVTTAIPEEPFIVILSYLHYTPQSGEEDKIYFFEILKFCPNEEQWI